MRDDCVVESKDPCQGWLTLKDLARGGCLLTELTR